MSSLRPLLRSLRALRGWRQVALLGRPLRRFHPQLGRVVRIPGGSYPFADEAVWHLSGHRTEFAVPSGDPASTARGMCPQVEMWSSYQDDFAELRRRLEAVQLFTHRLAQLADPTLQRAKGWKHPDCPSNVLHFSTRVGSSSDCHR
eukprot:symbB.v1.2.033652.t1/scaffold4211.1/size43043/2